MEAVEWPSLMSSQLCADRAANTMQISTIEIPLVEYFLFSMQANQKASDGGWWCRYYCHLIWAIVIFNIIQLQWWISKNSWGGGPAGWLTSESRVSGCHHHGHGVACIDSIDLQQKKIPISLVLDASYVHALVDVRRARSGPANLCWHHIDVTDWRHRLMSSRSIEETTKMWKWRTDWDSESPSTDRQRVDSQTNHEQKELTTIWNLPTPTMLGVLLSTTTKYHRHCHFHTRPITQYLLLPSS